MTRCRLSVFFALLGCSSGGSQAELADGGLDATADGTVFSVDSGVTEAESDDAEAAACLPIDASVPQPSNDCVFAGRCPAPCANGTASAYLCSPGNEGGATYPAAFTPPVEPIDILGTVSQAYPWEATAYLSCAALACTRWATADYADGGSAWAPNPCAPEGTDAGQAPQAWVCPVSPGVVPPPNGCVAAGDLQVIGGGDSGIPLDNVWCCPAPTSPDAGASIGAAGDASDAAAE